jgi:aryl-alcohol dehydrogenase-like predicted oxidoreductase
MKLALGCAQFGSDYGISNTSGRTFDSEVGRILRTAKSAGIDTLDTAVTYGDSEIVLGKQGIDGWLVVSKVPPLSDETIDGREWILGNIQKSLNRLNIAQLEACLLHSPHELLGKQGANIIRGLKDAKEKGLVSKIGYSIYSPDLLDQIFQILPPDIIQAPYNIFDQRLKTSGWLERLLDANVEVHIRSIFLQGLLLMDRQERPAYFQKWKGIFQRWDNFVDERGGDSLAICLGFAKSISLVSRIVVGVENNEQLNQLILAWNEVVPFEEKQFSCEDSFLIEPSNWHTNDN